MLTSLIFLIKNQECFRYFFEKNINLLLLVEIQIIFLMLFVSEQSVGEDTALFSEGGYCVWRLKRI